MPELPEVEVIRRALAPRLTGRRIVALACGDKTLRAQSPPERLRQWLPGRRILSLRRRGKYLLLHLEGGVTLLLHLGMTGRLLLGPPGEDKALPHVHLTLTLEDGNRLLFQDVRRFGQILVYPPGKTPEPLARVGQEPFSRRVTPAWLQEQARHRRRPIKNFLLDGRILAGIGNIYAAEILFAAGLHPDTPVGELSLSQWEAVLTATRRILRRAIARGGTTVNDYLQPGGTTGLFQVELAVYGREGEPCRRCGTLIRRIVQAGRSTFYCPRCQPAPRGPWPQAG